MNKQEVIERLNNELDETFAFQQSFKPLTWTHMECESKANAYMTAINYVEQLNEPQKVKVPAYVAEWIEQSKKERQSLYEAMYNIESSTYYHKYDNATYQWMFEGALHDEHQELFAEAYMHGYEVEEEPKYRVNIGGLYLKEPLADTNDFTISMTWNKDYAYPFDSLSMARKHTSKLGGAVEEV